MLLGFERDFSVSGRFHDQEPRAAETSGFALVCCKVLVKSVHFTILKTDLPNSRCRKAGKWGPGSWGEPTDRSERDSKALSPSANSRRH